MSAEGAFVSALREIADKALLQELPHPVVAPRTVEMARDVVLAAREHHFAVMVLGSGSSFPSDYALLRQRVVALLTVGMAGIERLSAFTVRVLAGTPVAMLVSGTAPVRRTLGGFLCDGQKNSGDPALRRLWPRVRAIEVVTARGDVQRLEGCSTASGTDPCTASLFLGSRGHLGMLAAVELMTPLPVLVSGDEPERRTGFGSEWDEPVLLAKDLQGQFDPDGLFQW
jgi:FAD/FMN-containing dehydrogenase